MMCRFRPDGFSRKRSSRNRRAAGLGSLRAVPAYRHLIRSKLTHFTGRLVQLRNAPGARSTAREPKPSVSVGWLWSPCRQKLAAETPDADAPEPVGQGCLEGEICYNPVLPGSTREKSARQSFLSASPHTLGIPFGRLRFKHNSSRQPG
jgi:hypothetical protein